MTLLANPLPEGSTLDVLLANHSTNAPTIIPPDVIGVIHTWVIIVVTVIVAILFVAVYLQLSLILCYGYKLFSYQTVFLYNILLWASFRLILNSFFFYNCCDLISRVSPTSKWFLVSFPEILLFISLSLLVHFFMEVLNQYVNVFDSIYKIISFQNLFKVIRRTQDVNSLNPSYRKIRFYQ